MSFIKLSASPSSNSDKVSDYDFKNHYPDVNMNMPWSNLAPYIRQAADRFINPYLGREFYTEVCVKISSGVSLSIKEAYVFEKIKDALAYYAITVALPKKKTIIASLGAVENVATEGTTASSLWGFKTTLWSVAQDADKILDEVLTFLEENSEQVEFETWKNSAAYSDYTASSDYFRTTKEFQIYYNINSSRRTFLSILSIIRQQVEHIILPIVGENQHNELVFQIKNKSLSEKNQNLLHKIRQALAYSTIAEAADALTILPDQDGFRVIGNSDAIDQRAYSSEVTSQAISRIKTNANRYKQTNVANLIGFLHDNKTDYPLWNLHQNGSIIESTISLNPDSFGGVFI